MFVLPCGFVSFMFSMTQMKLPLSELIVEDFQHGWTCFKFKGFSTTAKDCNTNKQLAIILTLLRGKLIIHQ